MPANNRFRLPPVMPPAIFRPTFPFSREANNIGLLSLSLRCINPLISGDKSAGTRYYQLDTYLIRQFSLDFCFCILITGVNLTGENVPAYSDFRMSP